MFTVKIIISVLLKCPCHGLFEETSQNVRDVIRKRTTLHSGILYLFVISFTRFLPFGKICVFYKPFIQPISMSNVLIIWVSGWMFID